MGISVTPRLLDKFHDLLKKCEADTHVPRYLSEDGEYDEEQHVFQEEVRHYLDELRCNMRRIKFVKTFLFFRDARWNRCEDLASLFDETIRCLLIFKKKISRVLRYPTKNQVSETFLTTASLCQSIQLFYGSLESKTNLVVFTNGAVFDEFVASVKDYVAPVKHYLMNAQMEPFGWLNLRREVEANFAVTLQWLERFRYLVFNFSKQCTDEKKLNTILVHAASVLFSILHLAFSIEFAERMEENILRSSSDMAQKLLPQNPDAMKVYLEALLTQVKILKASKPSLRSQVCSRDESFLNLLQSAQDQVQIVCKILDLPIMDLEANKQVEIWLKRGYAVVVREAVAGSLNHVVLSNLVHKLILISDQVFVLELHKHKASLTSCGSLATIRAACEFLSLFFKTPRVRLEGIDNLILALIEFSLRETRITRPFSEDLILESSFAIFKLFMAEATVKVLTGSTSSLKFLADFGTATHGKVSMNVVLDKFHDFLNQCPDSSLLSTYKRSARRGIKFLKTFLFYYDADLSALYEAEVLCEGTKTYFRWLIWEITKVLECEDYHHQDHAIIQSVVAVDLVRINVGEMYAKLNKVPHPPLFVGSVVFDEYAESVQQYLMNIPLEPIGWGRSPHDYGKVEGNYKDTVQWLEHFRCMVRSVSKQCTDQKILQNLLDGSTAMVISILHIAHTNDVSHTRTVDEENHIFCSSFDMAQRSSPQNPDARKLYLKFLSATVIDRNLMEVSMNVVLDKFHDFLNQCPDSSLLSTYKRSARRGIKFLKTFLFYYDADLSGLDEAEVLCEGTKTYFRWLVWEITKVLECEDYHHLDYAIIQSVVAVDLVRIKVGEMYAKLNKVPHPALFVDSVSGRTREKFLGERDRIAKGTLLAHYRRFSSFATVIKPIFRFLGGAAAVPRYSVVFDEYAESVQQYLMNIPLEPSGWGRSPHDYGKVEGNYKDTVQWLEHFRCMVRSVSKQCTDQKILQNLLDGSTAMVISILHIAHTNDVSHTRTVDEENHIFCSSFDMAQRSSPQNPDARKLYLKFLSATVIDRNLMEVSMNVVLDKFHDFLNQCPDSSLLSTYKRSARRGIKFLKTFLFYYDADLSGLDEAEVLCEGTKTYFRWLVWEITKVLECEDYHHLDYAIIQSVVAVHLVDLVRIKVGEMYAKLNKVLHPALFVDSVSGGTRERFLGERDRITKGTLLAHYRCFSSFATVIKPIFRFLGGAAAVPRYSVVFDEYAESVQQYLMNIPLEPIGWGRSPHDYGKVEGNYKDTVQWLEHFRCMVRSVSKQCTDQKILQNLLDGSTAMVISILHIAHTNDVSHTRTVDEENHIFCSSFDMAQRSSPQNPDARKLYLKFLSATVIDRNLMEVSMNVVLDKFHDFLNQCPDSSLLSTYKRSARRGIKFLKTFLFYYDADLSGLDEAEVLCEGTKTYFRWLVWEITKVLECEDYHHLDYAIIQSVVAVDLVRIKVGEMYANLNKVPHPALFVDSVVFDEYAESVKQYLMSIPLEPLGWGRSLHDYSKVEGNYKDTVQRLERFRYMVRSFSKQCTDQKILQNLLDGSTAMVFSILHIAGRNDVSHTRTIEEDDHIFHSSYDMAPRFSPQNAMKLYFEVLSANVWAPKQSSGPFHLMMKSFRNFLQSVQNQVNSLGHILDFPIEYIIDDNMDDCNEQYAVILREVGSICYSISNPVVPSNLLRKLNLIKAELLVLELHNHRSRLTYVCENGAGSMKEAFILLNQLFKTREVHIEGIEKLLSVLIEASLKEAGSLCDPHETKQFSEAMIVESSLAILKLLKAEVLLMLLNHNASSLKVLSEFHAETLQKSLIFLSASLSDPTLDSLMYANNSTVCETLATKAASFVCSYEDRNRGMDQPMQISLMPCQGPWSLFTNFPKSDGVVFVEHIVGKLRKLVSYKPDTYAFMKVEIDPLLKELDFFMAFLRDVKREYRKNKDLELRVTWLIYDAEYSIELFSCRDVPLCYLQLVLFLLVEESKVIEDQILDNRHDADCSELPLQNFQLTLASETSEDSNLRTEEVIVGLDDQAKDVIDQLQTGSEHLQVVSIVGMAGVGKTTLAKKVCTTFSNKYHFAACALCHVSPVYRKRELLFEILGDLVAVTDDTKKKDDNDLALLIKQKLHGKRYLIVVDDVWSIEHWDDLKLSFPDDSKGSRILITTRDQDVARKAGHDREPYVLHLLSPPQSWDLLRAKLFQGGEYPEQLLEAGKLVIEHCRGLPLAIVVIAGILKKTQMKKHQWEEIAKNLRSRIAYDEEIHFMDILEFSYNYLPSYLKPCYLYLGSFLEDQEIPVNKLLWLWIGEGFIPKLDHKSLEEIAEGYLVELINRSLVMETKRSSLGGTKACRIHDMLRNLCLKKAKEENFMQLISMNGSNNSNPISSDSPIGNEYRLSIHSPKQYFIQSRSSAPHVHSLIFFDTDNTLDNKSYDISSIFQDFPFLRVLDVESITASTFPSGADFLLGLSYLAIKGNVKSVPSSISKLWNLEILIVKGTRGDIALPSSLWSMEMLRHVYIRPQASLTLSSPEVENAMILEKLTTLSSPVFPNTKASEKILKRWIRLKKLRCIFLEHWDSSRKCNVFPSFELFSNLESLNIYYGGRSLPAELIFPLNLKKLTLSRFFLPWDYISVISRLSNLVVLKLLFKAFDGHTWEMVEENFPKLRVLKLENLNLANWNNTLDCVDHFPELERLVLSNCKKLGEIPSSFGEVLSLKMIEVNWCSPSAAKSVETIMDQQLDFDNRDFQVMITPSEWDFRTSS